MSQNHCLSQIVWKGELNKMNYLDDIDISECTYKERAEVRAVKTGLVLGGLAGIAFSSSIISPEQQQCIPQAALNLIIGVHSSAIGGAFAGYFNSLYEKYKEYREFELEQKRYRKLSEGGNISKGLPKPDTQKCLPMRRID